MIRKAVREDAECLLQLFKEVDQSNVMLYGPDERRTTPEQIRNRIIAVSEGDTSEWLVEKIGDVLAGYLLIEGNRLERVKHTIYLVIGISEKYRGQGIGTRLFEEMEKWAVEHAIRRMELTVLAQNQSALALYLKMGFEVEGTKRDSVFIDGIFCDEYYLSKLI